MLPTFAYSVTNLAVSSITSLFISHHIHAQSDWASSQWLNLPDDVPDNQLRATISIPLSSGQNNQQDTTGAVTRGTCFVAGLGYQRTWLNGRLLTTSGDIEEEEPEALGPIAQFQRRVPYQTYDVTSLLQPGNNTIAVEIGRGWYALPRDAFTQVLGWQQLGNRTLRMICRVTFDNGQTTEFNTGSAQWAWRLGAGELVRDHLFLGPTIDKTKATPEWKTTSFDDSTWTVLQPAPPGTSPIGEMHSFVIPLIRRHEPRSPVAIQRINDTTFVLDFEVNQAMQCELHIQTDGTQEPGEIVLHLLHDEQVNEDGEVVISNDLGNVADQTTFILDGSAGVQTFDTTFSYVLRVVLCVGALLVSELL